LTTADEVTNRHSRSVAKLFASVKSPSEAMELSTHVRQYLERITGQLKDLTSTAEKAASETVEPIKESLSKRFSSDGTRNV
jgi:hypothetical protein